MTRSRPPHLSALSRGALTWALLLASLTLISCASREIEGVFRENQQALIECQVTRASVERDADLCRGQRELAERGAEAAAERLAKAERALQEASAEARRAPAEEKRGERGERGDGGDRVLRALSDGDLVLLAERLGHAASPLERGVLVTFGDLKSRLYFNREHKVLSFISHFSGYRASLELVNSWNRDHRFGRVFIDAEGDVALETELDLEPGVRLEALLAWARSYGVLITLFHSSLKEAQRGGGAPDASPKGKRRGKQM